MQTILVVGGAGYIGSHMVLALQAAGYRPIVLDNLCKGHRDAVNVDITFIQGEMNDVALLRSIFTQYQIDAVMHFASYIEVGESVLHPAKYYQNNVVATLTLLDIMREFRIGKFIFSSTAAVYGEPSFTPITEAHPLQPVNSYGRSKYMIEQILQDYEESYALRFACLRYFNAAGADPKGRVGERHEPESHLIPLLLQVALGKRDEIVVYGNDYATKDGTCIRDYVHVTDLCDAHLLALRYLAQERFIGNLGTGTGYSVQEVIDVVKKVTGKSIAVTYGARRQGDPAILVADASYAKEKLGWKPMYSDLETIVTHAWAYYQRTTI